MTLQQLLARFSYTDLAPYIEEAARNNTNDRRDLRMKLDEVKEAFAEIKNLKPTFGHIDTHIEVRNMRGKLNISNMHLGSVADLLSHRVDIAADVDASEAQIAGLCVYQLVAFTAATERYRDTDDFCEVEQAPTGGCPR